MNSAPSVLQTDLEILFILSRILFSIYSSGEKLKGMVLNSSTGVGPTTIISDGYFLDFLTI